MYTTKWWDGNAWFAASFYGTNYPSKQGTEVWNSILQTGRIQSAVHSLSTFHSLVIYLLIFQGSFCLISFVDWNGSSQQVFVRDPITCRLWILQVFTVLCSIYENCNLIYAIQHKEIPKAPSPLIQVIEEQKSDVIL